VFIGRSYDQKNKVAVFLEHCVENGVVWNSSGSLRSLKIVPF